MDTEKLNVLLIEDDQTDVIGLKRAFDLLGIEGEVMVAETGERGIELLDHFARKHYRKKLPIIMLDINLPGAGGIETLEIIRSTPHINRVPVFMWSEVANAEIQDAASKLDIEGFLIKSAPGSTYAKAAAMMKEYWATAV